MYLKCLASFLTVLACARTCLNGGILNRETCVCNCANLYLGDTCEGKSVQLAYTYMEDRYSMIHIYIYLFIYYIMIIIIYIYSI